ncbi:MAG: hypothetical protein AB8H86_05695 [Polyangiales bacterium]
MTLQTLRHTLVSVLCAALVGCSDNGAAPESASAAENVSAESATQTHVPSHEEAARAVGNWFVSDDANSAINALLVDGRLTVFEHAEDETAARTTCASYAELDAFRAAQNERSLNGTVIECAEGCCEFSPPSGEMPDTGDFHTVLSEVCFEPSPDGLHLAVLHTFDGGV